MINGISGYGSSDATSLHQARQALFNKIDTNGDGSIDKTEMQAVAKNQSSTADGLFSQMDTDEDGLISKTEAEAAMAQLEQQMKQQGFPGMNGTPPSADDLFSSLDTNRDGTIDKSEITAALGQSSSDADKLFSIIDTNSDNAISADEFTAALKSAAPPMGPPPGNPFASVDTNQDGTIDKTEMTAAQGESSSDVDDLFSALDTNGDNAVSTDEFKAALENAKPAGRDESQAASTGTAASSTDWQSKLMEILMNMYKGLSTQSSDSTTAARYI
jgi:Ca2+-binding EF-hand superfamily protein